MIVYTATPTSSTVMAISRYFRFMPQQTTRNWPPTRRNTPMFNRPPRTMTTPASQRTNLPYRFSNNSGIVIAPESRSGLTQNPVQPTTNIASALQMPGIEPENPRV